MVSVFNLFHFIIPSRAIKLYKGTPLLKKVTLQKKYHDIYNSLSSISKQYFFKDKMWPDGQQTDSKYDKLLSDKHS